MVLPALKTRLQAAFEELQKLLQDRKGFPINYNHYYTDTVHKKRQERIQRQIEEKVDENYSGPIFEDHQAYDLVKQSVSSWSQSVTADMEEFSCEEALDCLLAIYKVCRQPWMTPSLPCDVTNSAGTGAAEDVHRERHDPGD